MDNENQNIDGGIDPKGLGAEGLNVESMKVGLPPELPSHEENKEKLVGTLHKDGLLPNLRTYHGDIAEFIKSKDQSLSTIVIANQEKKQEQRQEQRQEKIIQDNNEHNIDKPRRESFSELPKNFLIYVISLILILGTVATASYLFIFNKNDSPMSVGDEKSIIATDKTVVLESSGINRANLKETFSSIRNSLDHKNILTSVVISDSEKKTSIALDDLITKFNLNIPNALRRSLNGDFMLGFYDDGVSPNLFLILKIKDYGIAFRDMLEWESLMLNDLGPLLRERSATSTPGKFKDLIVRNKDTRASESDIGKVDIVYTFINKETLLITESENAVKGILDSFLAGNTVR